MEPLQTQEVTIVCSYSGPEGEFQELDDKLYKPELEQLDRNLAFSAELLRLSLLGIAVLAFIVKEIYAKLLDLSKDGPPFFVKDSVRNWFIAGTIAAILSAAFALFHRLRAINAMRYFIDALKLEKSHRHEEAKEELKSRERAFMLSRISKWSSAFFLATATLAIAIAFFQLFGQINERISNPPLRNVTQSTTSSK